MFQTLRELNRLHPSEEGNLSLYSVLPLFCSTLCFFPTGIISTTSRPRAVVPSEVDRVKQLLVAAAPEAGRYYNFRVPITAAADHGETWADTH